MSNASRGTAIRDRILADIREHPSDITGHIANIFSISPQAVYNHLKKLEDEGYLVATGTGKGKQYRPGKKRKQTSHFDLSQSLEEDRIWRTGFAWLFNDLKQNVFSICQYGFTEMVNNVIDHSGGTAMAISVLRDESRISIMVMDNGEGIFRKIKRVCQLDDEKHAILELSKGKLTTDPENHTGEGIFFTSRVFDQFEIDSRGLQFSHDDYYTFDYLIETGISLEKPGTAVLMMIDIDSERTIQQVFDEYTAVPDDFHFNKTVIPVKLAQYEDELLVSRSQAKRLLMRVDKFKKVIFDFNGVNAIGQAFADEIFRVYAAKNPDIMILPLNMSQEIEAMIKRARSNLHD
jgi:anti-sigma regulatory factor (Ser/Thr protein kinase)